MATGKGHSLKPRLPGHHAPHTSVLAGIRVEIPGAPVGWGASAGPPAREDPQRRAGLCTGSCSRPGLSGPVAAAAPGRAGGVALIFEGGGIGWPGGLGVAVGSLTMHLNPPRCRGADRPGMRAGLRSLGQTEGSSGTEPLSHSPPGSRRGDRIREGKGLPQGPRAGMRESWDQNLI